ncbi:hypothetical protein D8674_017142 [Pyrus ussuriensis x Pyrus communis]|uniref:Uncharacterized protein n=1 Tax=Pyrus ussuriensis x Pyrus communis TaxID=2448454 RepID=A0A5N5HHB2_9ROSA|nr:hypothetical protein D8674_017142 [Pyrus ussuriensis x Pyrus communis]
MGEPNEHRDVVTGSSPYNSARGENVGRILEKLTDSLKQQHQHYQSGRFPKIGIPKNLVWDCPTLPARDEGFPPTYPRTFPEVIIESDLKGVVDCITKKSASGMWKILSIVSKIWRLQSSLFVG